MNDGWYNMPLKVHGLLARHMDKQKEEVKKLCEILTEADNLLTKLEADPPLSYPDKIGTPKDWNIQKGWADIGCLF